MHVSFLRSWPKTSAIAGEFCNDSEDNVPYGSPDAIEMCEVLSQALQMHQLQDECLVSGTVPSLPSP